MRGASPRGRRLLLAAAVIALVLALALPASAATVVKLTSVNRYKPGSVQIAKGGSIKWKKWDVPCASPTSAMTSRSPCAPAAAGFSSPDARRRAGRFMERFPLRKTRRTT